ncbi:phosphocarrier protein HPr [Paenisporosarcina sp.]|uniref:phosphocarrier protein HPr n=1 Tax=Paenisporosarcina sp. TaxID=1932001 RepID=UPI003C7862C8
MIEKQYNITGGEGLHARPTSVLVGASAAFKSDISLEFNDKKVNLKSILGVMSLGVPSGATIKISADGEDEEAAMAKIDDIMKNEGIGN